MRCLFLSLICVALINEIAAEWCGDEDCYDVLKVTQRASNAEIADAYRRLSAHFDTEVKVADERIERAYRILSDERERKRYDYAIKNPDGWIDQDGNYNDQPGSMNYRMIYVLLGVGCIFFAASAKWVTQQVFWSKPPEKKKKSKKSVKCARVR